MDSLAKKSAINACKERKSAFGVYAVICNATGEAWVGISRNLEAQANGLWFALRMGSNPNRHLQAAWTEHGEDAFRFEELDRLSDDYSEPGRPDELKCRKALWQARLQASGLL
jgi:hypothetical protein